MASIVIRVTSRALGDRRRVIVRVYESLGEMRAASDSFNGADHHAAGATTQAYLDDRGLVTVPIVRLARGYLTNAIVSHELHHASAGIYGSVVGDAESTSVLTFHNEPFAHLFSDLFDKTVRSLFARGLL